MLIDRLESPDCSTGGCDGAVLPITDCDGVFSSLLSETGSVECDVLVDGGKPGPKGADGV